MNTMTANSMHVDVALHLLPLAPVPQPRHVDFAQFRREFVGRRVDLDTLNRRNKGALGQYVEQQVRASMFGQAFAWCDRQESAPDMGAWELKVCTFERTVRAGKSPFRAKEDLAIGQLSEEALVPRFDASRLFAKLNVLVVVCVLEGSVATIVDVHAMPLANRQEVREDYRALHEAYRARRAAGLSARQAISRLGAGTGGYGRFMKSKTKGAGLAGKDKSQIEDRRTRAWYVRASALTNEFASRMPLWDRELPPAV